MDIGILRSLATVALIANLRNKGEDYDLDGSRLDNGAEPPESLASKLIRTGTNNAEFAIGFDMALEIAAEISQNPTMPADITSIIERARESLAQYRWDMRKHEAA